MCLIRNSFERMYYANLCGVVPHFYTLHNDFELMLFCRYFAGVILCFELKIDMKYDVVEKPQASPISVIDIEVVNSNFSLSLSLMELTNFEKDVFSPFLKMRDKCDALTFITLAKLA